MKSVNIELLREKVNEIINIVTDYYWDRVVEITLPHSITKRYNWIDIGYDDFFVKVAFGRKYVHLWWRRADSAKSVDGVIMPCANYVKLKKSEFERILRELGVV